MKKILSLFGWLFLLVAFQACKSDNDMQDVPVGDKYYTTENNITILKDDAIQYIQENVTGGSLIVFSGSTPKEALPEVGAKLFIPISEKTPYGFLGKVKSIEEGEKVKVFTESLPLEEVFDNISIDTTMNITDKIDGVFDAEGNPIEYEQMDSTLSETPNDGENTRAGGYWQGGLIKFPFRIADKDTGDDNLSQELAGTIYVELKNFDFKMYIVNNEIKNIDVKADPAFRVTLSQEMKLKTPNKLEKSMLIGSVNCAPITIPTPILLIVLRPELHIYLVCGANGEITVSTSLQYQCSYKAEMHYRNGHWDNLFHSNGPKNEKPWNVTKFDMKGEVYAGAKMGIFVGFYSENVGMGINVTPKFSLGAEASLSAENLLDLNPQVELAAKWSGDLYFTASIFNRPIANYSFSTPEYVVWSEKMYLLPQFSDFTATRDGSSGKIGYNIDSHYFLSALGVKTGAKVYESDKRTEFATYYQSPFKTDNKGVKHYEVDVDGLSENDTYYAAPVCSWLDFTWPSSRKVELPKESGIVGKWKRVYGEENQYYDIIEFRSNGTGTMSCLDYDGPYSENFTYVYNEPMLTITWSGDDEYPDEVDNGKVTFLSKDQFNLVWVDDEWTEDVGTFTRMK